MQLGSGLPPISLTERERLLADSLPMINSHAAIVCIGGDSIYSGVYASSHGYHGILTAGHCASAFLDAEMIALPVSEESHRLIVDPMAFDHVPIGQNEGNEYPLSGPDLSFVVIREDRLVDLIKSRGYCFYDIDKHRTRFEECFTPDMDELNWCVQGSPREITKLEACSFDGEECSTLVTTTAVVQGVLKAWEIRGGFDYVTVMVGSGFEDFPASYNGVSGGAIWYQRFVSSDRGGYEVEPILAGIAVWQSQTADKRGVAVRRITGHGWVSIYAQVRTALCHKRIEEDGPG